MRPPSIHLQTLDGRFPSQEFTFIKTDTQAFMKAFFPSDRVSVDVSTLRLEGRQLFVSADTTKASFKFNRANVKGMGNRHKGKSPCGNISLLQG